MTQLKDVELSHRQNGQKRFRVTTGGPYSDCSVKLADREEGTQTSRKAPPPRVTDPTPDKGAPSTARKMKVEEMERNTIGRDSEGIGKDEEDTRRTAA